MKNILIKAKIVYKKYNYNMIFERKKYLDELQAKCLIQLPSTIPFTKNYDIMHLYLRNHVL